jgi:predicted ATPase
MALESIRIAGYKSIRDQTVELGPLNVLIGNNGAGKSNFLSVFELVQRAQEMQAVVRYSRLKGGADRLLHFGRKRTSKMRLELQYHGRCFAASLRPTEDNSLESWIDVGKTDRHRPSGDQRIRFEEDWRVFHFADTGPTSRIKQMQEIADGRSLKHDGANLAPFLYFLRVKHPAHYRQIVATVRLVAPFLDDFRLEPDLHNERFIQLEWTHQSYPDQYFNAYALSDGTLRFIALTTLLLQPNRPSLLLIDEPELGLHPDALLYFMEIVRATVAEGTQVILGTQSVNLVDQLDPEEVIVVGRVDEASVFRRFSEAELHDWLESYSLGELWEKNVLGALPPTQSIAS